MTTISIILFLVAVTVGGNLAVIEGNSRDNYLTPSKATNSIDKLQNTSKDLSIDSYTPSFQKFDHLNNTENANGYGNVFGDLIASYTTYFSTSTSARINNISLATEALNNAVIMPLETLSFNTIIGARSIERGYLPSTTIVNGQFREGIGGGICQVSTTLFNAWISGGLDIGVALNHSIPVGYVPCGLDATVSSAIDMVLINNSTSPIFIKSRCNSKSVSIYLYGKNQNLTYAISTILRKEIPQPEPEIITDDTLLEGSEIIIREGRVGYRIDCIRQTIANNAVIEERTIRQSHYPAMSSRIARPSVKFVQN